MSEIQKVLYTAGAVPVRNEKGELRMEKVKVTRYISGKRPAYAQSSSENESSSGEEENETKYDVRQVVSYNDVIQSQDNLLESDSDIELEGNDENEKLHVQLKEEKHIVIIESDKESDNEEETDEAIDIKRELMRQRAKQRQEEDLLAVTEEDDEIKEEENEEESSEYEEYSDSEDELGPRLKPVFIRKMDRVTIKDEKTIEDEEKKREKEFKKFAEKRKQESNRLLQNAVTEDLQEKQGADTFEDVINTDDENEEEEYEKWKLRELMRIKRDREELEVQRNEREMLEKIRNMSEAEKNLWLKANPRHVTNAQKKGKYKFLQKYYHRGAFYLDEQEDVYTRNFAEPTLEDHFDKTVLPSVMQVKDFGKAGRTKYTHLVDQDTTTLDNPWSENTLINLTYQGKGGGAREQFTKPSAKKQRVD